MSNQHNLLYLYAGSNILEPASCILVMVKQWFLILAGTCITIMSCKKKSFTIDNLNGGKISKLGHGGMGIYSAYPLNCYESVKKSLELGADGTEFDIQMTSDSVLVLFHDDNLSKKTNLSGLVNDHTWEEINKGYYTTIPLTKYQIVSLEDVFSKTGSVSKYTFTLDCKLHSSNDPVLYKQQFANAITRILSEHNLGESICIESTDEGFLQLLKQKNQFLKLFIYPSSFEDGLEAATRLGLYGITISNDNITKDQVKNAHDHNLRVAVWNTQQNKDNINAIEKSPDYIQTDKLRHLLRVLD